MESCIAAFPLFHTTNIWRFYGFTRKIFFLKIFLPAALSSLYRHSFLHHPSLQVDEISQIVTIEVSLRLHWIDERIKIAEGTLQSMGQAEEYVTLNPRLAKYFWIPGKYVAYVNREKTLYLVRRSPILEPTQSIYKLTLLTPCIGTLGVKRRRISLSKSSHFQTSLSTRPRSSESRRFTSSQPLSEFTGLLRYIREMSLVSAASILIPTCKAQESRDTAASEGERDTLVTFISCTYVQTTGENCVLRK